MAAASTSAFRPLPPGPRGLGRLGATLDFVRDWFGFFERCNRAYGDIVFFRILTNPVCLVFHPDFIEDVLVKNPANFTKSADYRALHPLLGRGLLTSEGELWQTQRRLIQPAFRHDRIVAYADVMLDAVATQLAAWRDGEIRDVHRDMMAVTLTIVAKSLFGADVSRDAQGIGQALADVMRAFVALVDLAFILPERVPLPRTPRLRRAIRDLDAIVYAIIRERRAGRHRPDDLLQALLEAEDENGRRMSDQQLRDELMTLLLAGHETTANALSFTWYLLAQNPAAEARLHAELDHVLGARPPAAADLPRLVFTDAVVKESLRLYPPAWGIGRRAIHAFELGGYALPAGTNVFLLQWTTQRDPRFFPDPLRFNPARWLPGHPRPPRFAYFPFGGGPRVCVGAGFATMEATLLCAAIAQRFRFSLVPGGSPMQLLPSVALRPKNGLRLRLHQRP